MESRDGIYGEVGMGRREWSGKSYGKYGRGCLGRRYGLKYVYMDGWPT